MIVSLYGVSNLYLENYIKNLIREGKTFGDLSVLQRIELVSKMQNSGLNFLHLQNFKNALLE